MRAPKIHGPQKVRHDNGRNHGHTKPAGLTETTP